MKEFYRQMKAGQGSYSRRVNFLRQGHLPFAGEAGVYQGDYLTTADQVIPF